MIKHNIVKTNAADAAGTSFHNQTVLATYSQIEKAFGTPYEGDEYKVTAEWVLEDETTGTIFTIYDYKQSSLYSSGLPSPESIKSGSQKLEWHIGSEQPLTSSLYKFVSNKVTSQ